jgi:hypothetical protein
MPLVGFEPTTVAFERAKTVHALDLAVTVNGTPLYIVSTYYFKPTIFVLYVIGLRLLVTPVYVLFSSSLLMATFIVTHS